MASVSELYLHTEQGVVGPLGRSEVRRRLEEGRIGPHTRVSPDGKTWVDAERIRGLLLDGSQKKEYLPTAVSRPEMRAAVGRIERRHRALRFLFPFVVLGVTGGVLAAILPSLYPFLRACLPSVHAGVLALSALPPAALLAGWLGHQAGNWVLRAVTGLNRDERRCLAMHLPWGRAPQAWPEYLRRWLYNGDWLVTPPCIRSILYMRAFVTGDQPEDIGEELAIWQELLGAAKGPGKSYLETGNSVRELACVDRLPAWTRYVDPGTHLVELERKLGPAGQRWASSILRRALARLPHPPAVEADSVLPYMGFEFYACDLRDGRQGLLVMLRPRRDARHIPTEPPSEHHQEAA